MTLLIERARAKVNLTLSILGRRPDGYHLLESLVTFAGCADVVTLDTKAPTAIVMDGPFAATLGEDTIVAETLSGLRAAAPDVQLGRFTITKNLPVAAGLGGGSADAAAALRLARRANPDRAHSIDWQRLAARLGADVPVCFASTSAWITGVGSDVTPLINLPPLPAVLVNTLDPTPADKTRRVFSALNASVAAHTKPSRPPVLPEERTALVDMLRALPNDLEPAGRRVLPALDAAMATLRREPDCRLARLSGAGPTCYGLFATTETAAAAAAAIAAAHPGWWVVPTTLG
jgi:4-diphosphocytidyl-2-C-methyl-D-erythritol kinase